MTTEELRRYLEKTQRDCAALAEALEGGKSRRAHLAAARFFGLPKSAARMQYHATHGTGTIIRRPSPRPRRPSRRSGPSRARSPGRSTGEDPEDDHDDLAASIEAVVERCRQVAADCGMAWIGDLALAELDQLRARSEEAAA